MSDLRLVPFLGAQPKILLVDIETFPNLYEAWRLWEGRALSVHKFSTICCFSVKWLGGKQTTLCLADFGGSEKKLVRALWQFVNEADMMVAHNGKAFDFGRMNAAFIKHGFAPPAPTQRIDTKRAAKRVFGFDSNSLDLLCQYLGGPRKLATGGYELWKECMANSTTAWRKMKKYNAHDVTMLEWLYLKLRPWMIEHPNVTLYTGGHCPKCGGINVQSRGEYRSATRRYRKYQCRECMGWLKGVLSTGRTFTTNTDI